MEVIKRDGDAPLSHWLQGKYEANEAIPFEEGWDRLNKDGIQQLFAAIKNYDFMKSPFSKVEYAMLYNLSYTLCGHNSHIDYSLDLYHRCMESIEKFMTNEMIPLLLKSCELNTPIDIIQRCSNVWQMHNYLTKWMSRLLMHLDRGVVVNLEMLSITPRALKSFKSIVFSVLHPMITDHLFDVIDELRMHDREDALCPIIKDCIEMLVVMENVDTTHPSNINEPPLQPVLCDYNEQFEQPFLQQACRYIRQKAAVLLVQNTPEREGESCHRNGHLDLEVYLSQVDCLLQKDLEQAKLYLPNSTLPKLTAVYLHELVVSQSTMLSRAAPMMVERALKFALTFDSTSAGRERGIFGSCTDAAAATDFLQVEDEALVTLARAYRLFSQADEIFPPSSLYQYERLDMPEQSSETRKTEELLQIIVNAFFSSAVKEGHLALVNFALKEESVEAQENCCLKRPLDVSEEVEGCERGKSSSKKACNGGGVKNQDIQLGTSSPQLNIPPVQSAISSSTSSAFVSPPLKRQKASTGDHTQTVNEQKRRRSGSGRKSLSSSKKMQQKSKILAEDKYVTDILHMLKIFNDLTASIFQSKTVFVQTMKKISREIVNKSEILDKEGTLVNINQVDIFVGFTDRRVQDCADINELDNFIQLLFASIGDKDLYIEGYHRLVSRRMLRNYSQLGLDNSSMNDINDSGVDGRVVVSLDLEKSFLSLIKQQCGNSCVVKIEGMLNDLYVSDTTNTEFQHRFAVEKATTSPEVDESAVHGLDELLMDQESIAPALVEERDDDDENEDEDVMEVVSPIPSSNEKNNNNAEDDITEDHPVSVSSSYDLLPVDHELVQGVKQEEQEAEQEVMPTLHVLLLTQNFWPCFNSTSTWASAASSVILPKPLALCQRSFADWFRTNKGRRLQWSYSHGEVCMRMRLFTTSASTEPVRLSPPETLNGASPVAVDSGVVFDLFLVPEQAVVLHLFNTTDNHSPSFTLQELQEQSGLDLQTLRRVLHSLTSQQHKVLLKDSVSTEGSSSSTLQNGEGDDGACCFSVNLAFRSRIHRCRLPMPSVSSTLMGKTQRPTEAAGDQSDSQPDISSSSSSASSSALSHTSSMSKQEVTVARKRTVEAAIVRLLKGRKSLSEREILTELQNRAAQSQSFLFLPDAVFVRKCLATLVEKDYIEPLESDPHQYVYCP